VLSHLIVTQLFSTGLNKLKTVPRGDALDRSGNKNDETEGPADAKAENQAKQERKLSRESPFGYAISCWLKHAMDVPHGRKGTSLSESLWELVKEFFWDSSGAVFAEWLRVYAPEGEGWHRVARASSGVRCLYNLKMKSRVTDCIHVAASYGLVDILEWAHPIGIDFKVVTGLDTTLVMSALFAGEEAAVKTILSKNGVDINQSRCGNPSATLEDCNQKCEATGGTVLEYTIARRLEMMELLLEQPGIEVDLVHHGCTALGRAIHGNYTKGIALLVGSGAKVALYNGEVLTIPQPS
jgi:hypothetical protein